MKKTLIIILTICILLAGSVTLVLFDSSNNAITRFETAYYDIETSKDIDNFDDCTILYLSDICYGTYFGKEQLDKLSSYIENLNYDLVIYSGNVFDIDYSPISDDITYLTEFFKKLEAKLGVFGIYGDYDLTNDTRKVLVKRVYEDSNIVIIEDTIEIFNKSDTPIYLAVSPNESLGFTIGVVNDYQNSSTLKSSCDLILSSNDHQKQFNPFVKLDYKTGLNDKVLVVNSIGLTKKDYRIFNNPQVCLITLKRN